MSFKKLSMSIVISMALLGGAAITNVATANTAGGIIIKGNDQWRIESRLDGGWGWEGGGTYGHEDTEKGARKAAKKAARAARKDKGFRDTNEEGCLQPGVVC